MNYKAIFLDLDGTFLQSDKTISAESLRAAKVLQKNGVHVVLASGRTDGGMKQAINALEMDKNGGYLVSYNGCKVLNLYTGETIFSQTLDISLFKEIYKLALACGLEPLIYGDNVIYSHNPEGYYAKHESLVLSLPVDKLDIEVEEITFPVHKCLAVGTPEKVSETIDMFKEKFGDKAHICKSCPEFLEFMPKGINKGVGVKHVLKALGIDPAFACACGDEMNDVEMLKAVGTSFAMGNANEEVKAITTHVVPGNDEDGVAHAIKKCFPRFFV